MPLNQPHPVNPQVHLPTTLDWYRQTATWLVSLATGALTIGIATADKLSIDTWWQKIIICLGVLAFLVSIGSGVWFYFWITSYGNHSERRDKYANFYSSASASMSDKANYLVKHENADSKMNEAIGKYKYYYNIMLWSFLGAIVSLALVLTTLMFTEKSIESHKLTVFTQGNLGDSQTFMLDENTGDTWTLTSDTTHSLVWQQVLIPKRPIATTVVVGGK